MTPKWRGSSRHRALFAWLFRLQSQMISPLHHNTFGNINLHAERGWRRFEGSEVLLFQGYHQTWRLKGVQLLETWPKDAFESNLIICFLGKKKEDSIIFLDRIDIIIQFIRKSLRIEVFMAELTQKFSSNYAYIVAAYLTICSSSVFNHL